MMILPFGEQRQFRHEPKGMNEVRKGKLSAQTTRIDAPSGKLL
jgi:hypothetical protein